MDFKEKVKQIEFKDIEEFDSSELFSFYQMRNNKTCDTGLLDTYIWKDYYNIKIAIAYNKAVLVLMKDKQEYFAAMPYCKEEDLEEYFYLFQTYFNEILGKPFKIYLADEDAIDYLKLTKKDDYIVKEEFDFKDYIYSAESLKNLSGKKFQKKRNLINKFEKEYAGRWRYESFSKYFCKINSPSLTDANDFEKEKKNEIIFFLNNWYKDRESDDTLEAEKNGIMKLLCGKICYDFKIGAIYVDDKIRALSIGSYNEREKMACISVEKGDTDIDGIYQIINREFIRNEFPDADIVNREDDMGAEGLRKSKESYNPIAFARKYMLLQKALGYKDEIDDYYEEMIN